MIQLHLETEKGNLHCIYKSSNAYYENQKLSSDKESRDNPGLIARESYKWYSMSVNEN